MISKEVEKIIEEYCYAVENGTMDDVRRIRTKIPEKNSEEINDLLRQHYEESLAKINEK